MNKIFQHAGACTIPMGGIYVVSGEMDVMTAEMRRTARIRGQVVKKED